MQYFEKQLKRKTTPGSTRSWINDWLVVHSHKKEYDVIDGLRGISIILVVACHVVYHNPQSGFITRIIGDTIAAGAYGVTVFFALSGFLISLPFWKLKNSGATQSIPSGYLQRRFWKIYPPLALSLILITPIYAIKSGDSSYYSLAFKWLTGIPLIIQVEGKLNPVMWSLVFELQFYVTLPLLFILTRKLDFKNSLTAIFMILLIVPSTYRYINLSQGVAITLHPLIKSYYPSALDAFAFGVLIGGLETLKSLKKNYVWLGDLGLIILCLGMILKSSVINFGLSNQATLLELLESLVKIGAGFLIFYITDLYHPRTKMFSAAWLRWLGIISYEWYLFHQPIFIWTRQFFGESDGNILKYIGVVGGSTVISLTLAGITYRYFSLPIHCRPTVWT